MRLRHRSCAIALVGAAWCSIITNACAQNYSDIWWNPSESGWGVTIADHETNIFGVMYAYRSDSRPVWYTIPGGTFSQGRRIFQGDVYVTKGPPYTNPVFDSSQVTATKVGTASFDFSPPGLASGTALFSYVINGVAQTKQIQRQSFGSAPPNWGTDHTDLWFNGSESGWGIALAQHGNNIFGVWYAYDTDGEPLWFVLPGGTFSGATSFSGSLYRTTGPYFGNTTFDPSAVVVTQVGSASITFDSTASFLTKGGQDACPGLGANFVETIGNVNTPRLICRQAFGNLAPTPVAGTCTGTYSARVQFPDCPAGENTYTASGNFTTTGVDYNAQGAFAGNLELTGEPSVFFGAHADGSPACNQQGTLQPDGGIAFNGFMNVSRIGQADFLIGDFFAAHAQFSVGTSTVLGTITGQYVSGQFSCTY